MHNDLGIRFRSESESVCQQGVPQRLITVNLAIKRDHERTVFVAQGLPSGGKVYDPKPAMAKAHRSGGIHIETLFIRPAVDDSLHHRLDQFRSFKRPPRQGHHPGNATHIQRPPVTAVS